MSFEAVTAMAQAAARLDEAARAAKEQEAAQRRQARRLRQAHDLIGEACQALGIDLKLDRHIGTDPEEESQSWQRTKTFSNSAR